MALPSPSFDAALAWTGAIAAIGIAHDALEFYAKRTHVLDAFFDWRVIRTRYYILLGRPVWNFVLDVLFSRRIFLALIIGHAIAAILFPLAVSTSRPAACVLAGGVFAVHCLSNVRLLIGRDGADQMQSIVWGGLFLACLPVPDWARDAAAGLIVAQLILSYLISGLAKASSPVWRRGMAISLIMRMATYCPRGLSRTLTRPAVSACVSWSTIGFELGAPFLLLAGRPGAVVFVFLAGAFHGGVAVSMGLTTFVYAFVAAFPLTYYFASFLG